MKVTIRPATKEDFVKIRAASKMFEMSVIPQFSPDLASFVAQSGESVVGFVQADSGERFGKDEGEISRIAVRKDYWKNGIGSKLFGKGIAFLLARGCKTVRVFSPRIDSRTEPAQRFYHSIRFLQEKSVDTYKGELPFEQRKGTMRKKKKPAFGLAPQNAMGKGRARRRVHP